MIPDEIKGLFMDFFKAHWKKAAIFISATAIGLGSMKFLGKDNFIEQQAEKMIEKQTGLEIDLSP